MTEKDMRLRLVVRRDGFPEVRLVWNVSLENDPTISKLLETVNETIPLEIEQKGLENYVVELHDDDGTSFECLHFQTVRSVLKPDDRVFIRALDRDDNKQRRISGRYRISSDGRHLIDGIPFGRRRLKASSSRPPAALPPRKRARLAYDQEDLDDEDDDDFLGDEDDTPMLLLTNGEQPSDTGDSSSVRINAEFDDADADAEDDDLDSEERMDDTLDHSEPENSDQEDQSESPSDEDMEDELDDEDLDDELQDLMKDNADYAEEQEEEEPEVEPSDMQTSDGGNLNKISALRAAFPSAPVAICEKLLDSSNGDLKAAYNGLVNVFEPKLSESALLAWHPSKEVSPKTKTSQNGAPVNSTANNYTKKSRNAFDDDEDQWESTEEEEEDVPDFVRQFDHRGLPPGSITSGKGLAEMAAVSGTLAHNKINGASETTSATLNDGKASPEKTTNEDDDTSSDATSSSSEGEDSESESDDNSDDDDNESSDDNSNEDGDSNDSEDDSEGNSVDLEGGGSPASDNDASSASGSGSDSPSEDDSEDDSEDNSEENDSGPEVSSSRLPLSIQQGNVDEEDSSQDETSSDSSSNDSDISSEDSSEAESASGSESEQVEEELPTNHEEAVMPNNTIGLTQSAQQTQPPLVSANPAPQVNQAPVPPGSGKESTRRRNARRRAAKRAKQRAQQLASTTDASSTSKEAEHPTPLLDEKALFEAKRQELLDAIADGGVEVGPPSQSDESSRTSNLTKRKRQEQDGLDQQATQEATPAKTPASEDDQSPASTQKRRRIDVSAGRRMLFGALGLRNPKTKEDEEKLRAKLMKDVRPLENLRLKQDPKDAQLIGESEGKSTEEDLDSWKNKIIYRAVECCQEGIVLSEPPFPFIQRWDPQQQGYWSQKKNKRGGQSKRTQRNEAHFYQDSRLSKKRKHDESAMWDEEGYDDTFNGIDDTTNADVELNYDDPEDDQHYETNGPTNDASQFTDMDDLPSLPSDLSTLPVLRPGEVQVGMVITWQQWSCSSATGWQPQLSNVTGVVVRIDDDATGVEVCLAKRDRYLDRNEKKYDQKGQRIYDKFEAPDFDDEEEEDEDEGFRTMGFAEMQQPRILQQPLPAMTTSGERGERVGKLPAENPVPGARASTAAEDMQNDTPEESNPREPVKENAPSVKNSETSQSEQEQQASDGSVSGLSQISSPSRQLHESTSQAIGEISRDRSTQDISSRRDAGSDVSSDKPNPNMSGSGIPSARQSSAPLFDSHEDEVVVGTPKRLKTKAAVPPSSVSSARSGRQPDYAMDMNDTQPDSLKITDDGVSAAANSEGPRGPGSDEDASTPTPKPDRQSESVFFKQEGTAGNDQPSSPANPSTPSSLSSINTVWNTARTALSSRNTQTPSLSQQQSQPITAKASEQARALKDQEYEEAMRKLDDFSDDQESLSRVPDSFKPGSQASGLNGVAGRDKPVIKPKLKSPQIKISPPPTRRRRLTKPPTQFTLPPGTQVVDLSSDSEPAYTENYADDDVDGTYSPEPDSFPRSNGWVHKKVDAKNRKPRNMSAPVGTQPMKKELLSSSQSYRASLPMSSISNPSRLKSRKTSSRF
ncbi:uncharacterized protein F4807DRAFT_435928 [Annulohypoxylon truncatum]|uniref:uncharacterized protein n=1 Tax=Annulohypoxylon truncatum TaxID=327061 RepID=UPI0020074F0E|nr:uncharacterized protein F4807DRAFT_435928 [Annulohypoxylon truncatum]KAI1207165.1 hypothetical protein F4807DRAFT_435928 [Annulohypoxylon truncatum]